MKILPSLFSPAGKNAKLSIAIYHRVLPEPDFLTGEGGIADFEKGLGYLARNFHILPLAEAANHLRNGTLPNRAACITFDDGYADNAEIALPLLQKYGLPATFFIAAGFLDGGRMWNDTVIESVRLARGDQLDLSAIDLGNHDIATLEQRRKTLNLLIGKLKYLPHGTRASQIEKLRTLISAKLPDNLMMTSAQVRQLHDAGMEIGGHTLTHPILASIDETAARMEITKGKAKLEAITGTPLRLFAYPNGKPGKDYLSAHVEMVKDAGFEAAVSTAWGAARQDSDLFQLPRFTPWDKSEWRYVLRMTQNMRQDIQIV
ncbi:polysaccharide deacetylase family protein [Betaproteobacteria bacterium PRO4]|uniref:polysaccharide deacetylase family protein n=1 Tax=Nitrosomonas sp. TaxID=42353 RepID=UPI00256BAB18|nr:polysaccharide deacetylase family protein [Nitrosomonas sp.]MDL1866023.1 polysaccharide deacetylase family protein [Betaproteobacteria bacterium PRO4]